MDQNSKLWGKNICGANCKPLSEIPKNAQIWIAVENEREIFKNLTESGYKAKMFSETNEGLFKVPPTKDGILNLMEHYEK